MIRTDVPSGSVLARPLGISITSQVRYSRTIVPDVI